MSPLHHGLICVPSFYPLNTYTHTHLACPPDRYGEDCEHRCWCYGHSVCNQTTGKCACQPGRKGFGCYQSEFTSQGNVHTHTHTHTPTFLSASIALCSLPSGRELHTMFFFTAVLFTSPVQNAVMDFMVRNALKGMKCTVGLVLVSPLHLALF